MECWWAQPSSHDGRVHVHSHAWSVSRMQVMAAGWDFADVQNQLDGTVRNKAIYQKVATALGPFSTLDPFSASSTTSSAFSSAYSVYRSVAQSCQLQLHNATNRHENKIYVSFFAVSYDSHMHWSRAHAFTQYRIRIANYGAEAIEVNSNRIREFALNAH